MPWMQCVVILTLCTEDFSVRIVSSTHLGGRGHWQRESCSMQQGVDGRR